MGNSNNKPIAMDDEKIETSKANEIVVRYSTTADGLNMKFVSLASHKLVPSKFEDLFKEDGKQAKQLAIEYTAEKALSIIADGRKSTKQALHGPQKLFPHWVQKRKFIQSLLTVVCLLPFSLPIQA